MMTQKYHLTLAGGLGDCLYSCLADGHEYGKLPALKAAHPAAVVTCITFSCNDRTQDLFLPDPRVARHEHHALCPDWHARASALATNSTPIHSLDLPWAPPAFRLDPTELRTLNGLPPQYVAVHPFAGTPDRSLADRFRCPLPFLLGTVARSSPVPLVLLGGPSHRYTDSGDRGSTLHEAVDLRGANLISLVGVGSIRLHAEVVRRENCLGFVGTMSAYNCVATACGVRSCVFTREADARYFAPAGAGGHAHGVFRKLGDAVAAGHSELHYFERVTFPVTVISDYLSRLAGNGGRG